MSNDPHLKMFETKIELNELKEEAKEIQKQNNELTQNLIANNLIQTVSNNEGTFSNMITNNDCQSRPVNNSLAIVQRDETTLLENMASSSARVLNHDQKLSETNEILRKMKETILLLGGHDGKEELDSLLILENNREKWKELNIKLPYAIDNHGAQFLNNTLYIFGGYNPDNRHWNWTHKLSKSLQWERMADMNEKRYYISRSSVILNNQIWVLGGHNGAEALKSVEMFDTKTNKWKYMKEMNKCRSSAAAAVVNGRIFCFCGWNDSVECYDPSSNVWTRISNMPREIRGHGAVEIDGNFIVMGGRSSRKVLKNVWVLDTTDKNAAWIEKPPMLIPRKDFSIAKIDDIVFICGGYNGEFLCDVDIFDREIWRNGPRMPTPRENASAVVIPIQFARYLN